MTKWEYMRVDMFETVKKLGREGWELAGISYNPEACHRHTFYLKRPKAPKKRKTSRRKFYNPPNPELALSHDAHEAARHLTGTFKK